MRYFLRGFVLALMLAVPGGASSAAEKADRAANEPALPAPIAELRGDGATIKYLGRDLGYDGWIAVKDGQEQYFYVTPDGSAFFLGVLFNKNGRAVTFDQLKRLQGKKDPLFDDLYNAPSQKSGAAGAMPGVAPSAEMTAVSPLPGATKSASSSPADALFADVSSAYSFPLGQTSAPAIYMFVDPLCPHCKDMLKILQPAIKAGQLRVNVLLIGALHPESRPLATGILASSDPGAALTKITAGNIDQVKPGPDQADPRLDGNLALLQKWRFDGTPVTTYRAKDGTIKLLQGSVARADLILNDLP